MDNTRMIGTIVQGVYVDVGHNEAKGFQNHLLPKCMIACCYRRFL